MSDHRCMTAAKYALLRRVRGADQGLGVPLTMAAPMVQGAFAALWIFPTPRPWARCRSRMRFSLTPYGRAAMAQHEETARELERAPRRRLYTA